jgi:two-component system, cell cycle response regulator
MKVLVAEDDPVSRKLLVARLRDWDFEPVTAHNGEEALALLRGEDAPALAILDWMMPRMDGVDVCRALRAENRERYTYVLLLTARGEQADIVAGLEAGADDYIVKPFDKNELKVRLAVGRRIVALQRDLIEARETLRYLAMHDSLTGLMNRMAVLDAVNREISRSRREGSPLSVILADLDFFKALNDRHGHLAGDTVLRETARRMTAVVRQYDTVGRYGGEEFLVVLPNASADAARDVAERIRHAIQYEPMAADGRDIDVAMSLGVSTVIPDESTTERLILKSADDALYRAKTQGRNRVVAAGDPPPAGRPATAHRESDDA